MNAGKTHAPTILIVEDSESLALTHGHFLAGAGYASVVADSLGAAERHIGEKDFAAILLDIGLPDGNGLDFLRGLRARAYPAPVVVLTADSSVDTAVAAIREGAEDFIVKPVSPERLHLTLKNILEKKLLQKIVDGYSAEGREGFCDFIGSSPAMQVVYRILENAAQSRAPVFITGESGTGKELAARAIHQLSRRKAKAFEALNCAAIPGTLLESEMFGHVRGAFTGAVSAHTGAAERAHQGTLFLDELGDMPVEMQSKLLRFTQNGTFRPVGGLREISVDARFVSATNRDPAEAVRKGILREDLFYRLNVIPVHLPPLRERGGDVVLIAEALLKKIAAEERKKFRMFADDARDFLLSCGWPGNVRQLQNTIQRAVVMNEGEALTRAMLHAPETPVQAVPPAATPPVSAGVVPLHEVERRVIEQAIALCGGNISEAARQLELDPSTLHRKIGKWKKSS